MWTMLAFWACGGNPAGPTLAGLERTSPWVELSLPEGRTVASDPDGLVVRYEHDDVAEVDRAWRTALSGSGFEVVEDTSRDTMVACTWARGEQSVALSISAIRGTTTVSLQDVP